MNFIKEEPISILTPTYNRSAFLPLYVHNLINMHYPKELLEVVIDDDGSEPFIKNLEDFKKQVYPIKVKYIKSNNKRTIGQKRNHLVKEASHKIVCFMDDDDIYMPQYIFYSFQMLKYNKAGIVGSNQMLFVYPHKDFKLTMINCAKKHQMHEATMMMTKKYWRGNRFGNNSKGEGANVVGTNDKNVVMTDIRNIMVCVVHNNNTINKEQFDNDDTDLKQNLPEYDEKVDILKSILL